MSAMMKRLLPPLLFLALFIAAPAHAQLRSHNLRFIPPSDARVIGFHVYVSANSMSYADWRDNVNFIPPIQSGAASYSLTGLEAADDVYISMKSYDAVGQESSFSNEIVLPAVQACLTTGCNDDNPCTRDTCGATGCTFDPAPLRGTTCNDGNATTFDDVCTASGSCAGTPGQCEVDADCPASTNVCAGPQVCSGHMCVAGAPRADGTTCSDGNATTRFDICEAGVCRGYACGSDAQCGDGEACNGSERCVSRSCVAGTPMVCGDGDVCNGTETCRASACVAGTAMQCPTDDGPCFDAFCDPAAGCRVQLHPEGSTCSSTSGVPGQCAAGVCTPPQACLTTGCNDGNPCTRDTCGATGCTFDPAPMRGTTCSDGNATTFDDVCTASGSCAGTPGQCEVDTDCAASTDMCAGPRVCSSHMCVSSAPRADGTTCSDGNASTRFDVCQSGVCRGFACGSDAQCSDGEACNGAERCVSNACVAGPPMVCGDGDVCNGAETCRNSTCLAGTSVQCPADPGPCMDSFCDPAAGCRVQAHPNGSMCTMTGTSAPGQCSAGACVATMPGGGGTDPTTCEAAFGAPSDVHQVRTDEPETSRKIVWSAPLNPMGSLLEYRKQGGKWTSLRAVPESSSGCEAVWSATIMRLKPGIRYSYRVSGASAQGRVWSEVFALHTGPVSLRERFKFAFFASNGVDGSDQSPQAKEVLTKIKKGGFPLVLGGGGYALSNEAMAAGEAANADEAVEMWKDQASVVTGNAIFAPVLGDTEIESFAHAERAADYAEFMGGATTGSAVNGSYSYDFAGTHFVAVHAPNLGMIHPGTAAGAENLAWIEADLAAARAAKARWIVVYMHTDLFSSQQSPTTTATARTALGTIFQRHGVNLVLSGEGDSYERTKALSGNLASPRVAPVAEEVVTETDGIVFIRAGSGGRTDFGDWVAMNPPLWSAHRNNTLPIFLQMNAGANTLRVTAIALDEKGKKVIVDTIEIH